MGIRIFRVCGLRRAEAEEAADEDAAEPGEAVLAGRAPAEMVRADPMREAMALVAVLALVRVPQARRRDEDREEELRLAQRRPVRL